MYLDTYGKECKDIVLKDEKEILKLPRSYRYWVNNLFERCCRIFEWTGLPFEQKELETRVLMWGFTGFVNDKRAGYVVTYGSMHGVTEYFDKFSKFTYAGAVLKGGTVNIGKDCVIINNTSLRNSLIPMIKRYASMLAHAELSVKCALVNMRKTEIFAVEDDSTASSVRDFHKKIYEGEPDVIIDKSLVDSIKDISGTKTDTNVVKNCWDMRQDILRAFYNEIGVRYAREKKERLIEAETNTDSQMLLLNINDMLKQRELACDEINKIFGLNVSVKLSKEFELITGVNEDDNDY